MTRRKRLFFYFSLAGVLTLFGCTGNLPTYLGQFAPCPDSPNCVSSQSKDEEHAIAPIPYFKSKDQAKKRLLQVIHSLSRSRVVLEDQDFLHVEFTSQVFRFVDDVEFYLAVETSMIHFRSASRLGYSDLGANRKRMETIRSRFTSSDLPINKQP